MHTIEAEHLTRDYCVGRGVFDLSLSVAEGEAFGFLGPNGAGKTTVIRHLMGFLRPQSGRCRMGAWDCWAQREQVQGMVGYVPGEIAFFEDMRGTDFLRFVEDYRGVSGASRREALLERLELDPRVAIRKMSKGNKQKLAITAALLHDPQVLILDEPTSGLDPLMQSRFVELIREEKRRGKTIFLSSHMFEEVERTCDRIGIIRGGKMVAVDAVEALRERHLRSYTVTLDSEAQAIAFARDFHGTRERCRVTVTTRQSLEEIFMDYYGGEQA